MYRSSDPRFRRRLNEIGATLENANEATQSGIYIFGQNYVKPCLQSVGACLADCIDAGCPSLNLRQRDRLRRQRTRGNTHGRAELNFDFYDDWDNDDETDGLLGWGNDEFDRLLVGGGGYGTVAQSQPARQKTMSYPKARRKSAVLPVEEDLSAIPGSSFFGKLFGGKASRYRPSAAGLQEHPGARRSGRDRVEGEALLEESETSEGADGRNAHRRRRSNTANSGETTDSYSSRGDLFPSDEEDDAIPLDDEFAMVLERRATISGPDTDSGSPSINVSDRRRGKRPSTGSRNSTRRTVSTRSSRSASEQKESSRRSSIMTYTPPGGLEVAEVASLEPAQETPVPTLNELKQEEREAELEEEEENERRRTEAHRLADEKGLAIPSSEPATVHATAEADRDPPTAPSTVTPVEELSEPSQLPTPLSMSDEVEPQLPDPSLEEPSDSRKT